MVWIKNIACVFLLICTAYVLSGTQNPKLGIFVEKTVWSGDKSNISRRIFDHANAHDGVQVNLALVETNKSNPFLAADAVCQLVEGGSQVVISLVGCKTAKLLISQARLIFIPQMLFIDEACRVDLSQSLSVVFQPNYNVFGKIAADISTHMKWVDVILVHDGSLNVLEVHEFLVCMSKSYTRTRLLNLSNGSAIADSSSLEYVVATVRQLHIPTFVYLTVDNTNLFLEMVKHNSLFSRKYFWILKIDKPNESLRKTVSLQTSNVILVSNQLTKPLPPNNQSTYSDEVEDVLLEDAIVLALRTLNNYRLSHNGSFSTVQSCMDSTATFQTQSQEIAKQIRETDSDGISGRISFDESLHLKNAFYAIESTNDNVGGNLTIAAKWTTADGLLVPGESIFHNAFYSFSNRTLVISSQEMRPFVQKETISNQTRWVGMCIDILDELASTLKFKYNIIEPEDDMWGGPNNDGTWNGIVGKVQRQEVEFGIGPFTITSLRERVIDFTKPFMEDGVGIITKREQADSGQFFKIFQPFQYDVWIFTGIAILIAGVALFVINKFSPLTLCAGKGELENEKFTLNSSIWLIFGTYMEQGGEPKPSSTSGRIVLGFWWLFTLLMASTYTANLAAFLTVTIAKKPINSLAELATQRDIKPNIIYGTNLYDAFEHSSDALYANIWQAMAESPKLKEITDQLGLVRTGEYALLADRLSLEYIAYSNCESYSLADEISNTAGYGFVLPENAPYMDAFNHNIIKMQESGLMAKWRKKWWSAAESCSGEQTHSGADILDLNCIGGLFAIYGILCCSAIVCLCFEMLVALVRNKKCIRKTTDVVDISRHAKCRPITEKGKSQKKST